MNGGAGRGGGEFQKGNRRVFGIMIVLELKSVVMTIRDNRKINTDETA
jgi:hypothetical protein